MFKIVTELQCMNNIKYKNVIQLIQLILSNPQRSGFFFQEKSSMSVIDALSEKMF